MTAEPERVAARETTGDGRFVRQASRFTDRVSADGTSGFPAQSGRYHLYVSLACPWAHRVLLVRELCGLHDHVSASAVDPIRDERGWRFDPDADPDRDGHGPDPVNGFTFLAEAYLATDPDYGGRVTVPVLWDREHGRVVSNEFRDLPRQMACELAVLADEPPDLYPEGLRGEIDEVEQRIYEQVANGVYRAGFATSQQVYADEARGVFDGLDWLEQRLADRRYLVGRQLTLADVALYVVLVRFDAVYYSHFKCNLRRVVDYPALWAYARDLYQRDAFARTTDFDHIKRHYYGTHPNLNPTGIVPIGPQLDWQAPHGRERLDV